MTAKTTATRAEAIAAAADKFDWNAPLPHWSDHEYMHGICSVLAETFGVDEPENARSEVWEEIRAAFEHTKRRVAAEQIAMRIASSVDAYEDSAEEVGHPEGQPIIETFDALRDMLTAAALAGLEPGT